MKNEFVCKFPLCHREITFDCLKYSGGNIMKSKYQCCGQCIMDTSDPNIIFDAKGVCNHCHNYLRVNQVSLLERKSFEAQLDVMRAQGGEYQCVIGVSGGLDSTFLLLHAVRDLGLKPLAVHVDNGWNNGLANKNIARLCEILSIDLHTVVLDWSEFRLMQLAILEAGVPDLEAPTDLFINYTLRSVAKKFKIKYIMSGTNPQTEAVMGSTWSYGQRDPIYLSSLYTRFAGKAPRKLPFKNWYFSILEQSTGALEIVRPLKFISYSRQEAVKRCKREVEWREYPRKHGESFITRFYQNYFLPVRFGFDKRRAHYSALILNGEITREDAITALSSDPISGPEVSAEIDYFCRKLEITRAKFDFFMNKPLKFHTEYSSIKNLFVYRVGKNFKRLLISFPGLYRRIERLILS
jgi:N-acetyl sugar amidotransferase